MSCSLPMLWINSWIDFASPRRAVTTGTPLNLLQYCTISSYRVYSPVFMSLVRGSNNKDQKSILMLPYCRYDELWRVIFDDECARVIDPLEDGCLTVFQALVGQCVVFAVRHGLQPLLHWIWNLVVAARLGAKSHDILRLERKHKGTWSINVRSGRHGLHRVLPSSFSNKIWGAFISSDVASVSSSSFTLKNLW